MYIAWTYQIVRYLDAAWFTWSPLLSVGWFKSIRGSTHSLNTWLTVTNSCSELFSIVTWISSTRSSARDSSTNYKQLRVRLVQEFPQRWCESFVKFMWHKKLPSSESWGSLYQTMPYRPITPIKIRSDICKPGLKFLFPRETRESLIETLSE